MSNNKPIQFKFFGAILTKMELFWLFQISTALAFLPENSTGIGA
jgi:hypothetical protein